jgi:uncharacterized membrane protein
MMDTQNPDWAIYLVIGGSALATYGLRLGGLLLAARLPRQGGFKRFMDALPGTILLSLVAPGILAAGAWGVAAALVTAVCAYKTNNAFLAMLLGMGIIALQRHLML